MACGLDKLDPLGRSSCLDQIVSYVSQRASATRRKTVSALRDSRLRILVLSWIGVMDSVTCDRLHAGPEKGTGCIIEFSPLCFDEIYVVYTLHRIRLRTITGEIRARLHFGGFSHAWCGT